MALRIKNISSFSTNTAYFTKSLVSWNKYVLLSISFKSLSCSEIMTAHLKKVFKMMVLDICDFAPSVPFGSSSREYSLVVDNLKPCTVALS